MVSCSQEGGPMTRVATTVALLLAGALAAAAQPVNDDCANASVIGALPFSASLNTSTATSEPDDPPLHCNFDFDEGTRTVWYSYTASQDVALEVSTLGSDYDTIVAMHGGTCGALTQLACKDPDAIESFSRVFVAVASGETVLIEVAAAFGGGNLELSVTHAPVGHPAMDGPEFLVNTYTTGDQGYYFSSDHTSVCTDDDGNFVVVWEGDHSTSDGQDGSYSGIFGQRFASGGAPLGAEFQVNVNTPYFQEQPSVGCDPDGDFVVVWADEDADAIVARLYDGTGAPSTGEVVVDSVPACCELLLQAKVDVDASGNFVVAWSRNGDAIHARRFDAAGAALAAPFQVSTTVASGHYETDVAIAEDGSFVVIWEVSDGLGFNTDVRGRRYDPAGDPLAGEFTVNSYTTGDQREPEIGMDGSGNFVVAWEGVADADYGAIARRFDAAGVPQGPDFLVSTNANANIYSVDVAADAAGNFMVVWDDVYEVNDIFLRRFETAGNAIGDVELTVNTVSHYNYFAPRVAAAPAGDFVVVWTGYDGQDPETGYITGGYGVKAQRFAIAPEPPPAPEGCPLAARTDCKQPTLEFKGRLAMKDKDPDKGDALVWKWVRGDATSEAEIGDPLATDSYFVCLYDGGGTRVSESIVEPGGTCGVKPCWKGLGNPPGSKGYKYVNKVGNDAGVKKLILKPGDQGKAKAIVTAKGEALDMPVLPLALPVTAQLVATTGTCWSASFEPAGVLKNTDGVFAAKAALPAGSPSGAFVD